VQGVFDYDTPHMSFGRVVLIGDAALVVRPHTAMGVAKAACDVMSLAAHLAELPLRDALKAFGKERSDVAWTISAKERQLGRWFIRVRPSPHASVHSDAE
jgi:2-polyprenyl-6-methoxyphenol hydroxylase-like FAD-dependent oxidoreductase